MKRTVVSLCFVAILGSTLLAACGAQSCVEHLTVGTQTYSWCFEQSSCGKSQQNDTFESSTATCQDQGYTDECTDSGTYYVMNGQCCTSGCKR